MFGHHHPEGLSNPYLGTDLDTRPDDDRRNVARMALVASSSGFAVWLASPAGAADLGSADLGSASEEPPLVDDVLGDTAALLSVDGIGTWPDPTSAPDGPTPPADLFPSGAPGGGEPDDPAAPPATFSATPENSAPTLLADPSLPVPPAQDPELELFPGTVFDTTVAPADAVTTSDTTTPPATTDATPAVATPAPGNGIQVEETDVLRANVPLSDKPGKAQLQPDKLTVHVGDPEGIRGFGEYATTVGLQGTGTVTGTGEIGVKLGATGPLPTPDPEIVRGSLAAGLMGSYDGRPKVGAFGQLSLTVPPIGIGANVEVEAPVGQPVAWSVKSQPVATAGPFGESVVNTLDLASDVGALFGGATFGRHGCSEACAAGRLNEGEAEALGHIAESGSRLGASLRDIVTDTERSRIAEGVAALRADPMAALQPQAEGTPPDPDDQDAVAHPSDPPTDDAAPLRVATAPIEPAGAGHPDRAEIVSITVDGQESTLVDDPGSGRRLVVPLIELAGSGQEFAERALTLIPDPAVTSPGRDEDGPGSWWDALAGWWGDQPVTVSDVDGGVMVRFADGGSAVYGPDGRRREGDPGTPGSLPWYQRASPGEVTREVLELLRFVPGWNPETGAQHSF